MAGGMPSKVFIIDNDFSVMQRFKQALAKYNVNVDGAQDLETARLKFEQDPQEIIVVDMAFKEVVGLALIQKLRETEIPDKRAVAYILMCQEKLSKSDQNLIVELLDIQMLNKPINLVASLTVISKASSIFQKQCHFEQIRHQILSKTPRESTEKAAQDVMSRLKVLGAPGVQLILDLYEKYEQWDKVLAYVDVLLQKDPTNIRLLYAKARGLQKTGKPQEALQFMEPVNAKSPSNLKRLRDLGALYLDLKLPEKAIETTKQVMAYSAIDQDEKYKMYSMLTERGFETEAVTFGQEVMDPTELIRHYNNLGIQLTRERKFEEAIKEYQAALKVFPEFKDNFKLYYNLALCFTKIKDSSSYRSAEKALERCLQLNPEFGKAKETLAKVQTHLNKNVRHAG